MNSKRQRRPNVRLGEVGDVPAAFACGFSHKTKQNLAHRNDVLNPIENEHNQIAMQDAPEFLVLAPSLSPSPRVSADSDQNRENNDPNSSKSAFELMSSDEIDMSKLNFGSITRKCRVMKRRGPSIKGVDTNMVSSVWSSKVSPRFSSEDGRDCSVMEFAKFNNSDECDDYCPPTVFKDLSDHETQATSKEICEMDEHAYDTRQGWDSNDHLQEEIWHDLELDKINSASFDVNTVTRWLEDQGFGKYAEIFRMHEVDQEALPLLTLEDLKEMGLFAVGSRRKLYNAIEQLRSGGLST
ncbi:uncharacterized protein LOC126671218 [Mercurialis annua]|uniref:uncharacterized protein LOC126671218 n=1 Tax=Mercurialis annua TaxID=3986 RepID=UPI00215F070E|nr:uncharacterized protein LOC126671218 [Mercurialis annua]